WRRPMTAAAFIAAFVFVGTAGATAETGAANMATNLASMRQEVAELHLEAQSLRDELRKRRLNMVDQENELRSLLQREELRANQLNLAMQQIRAQVAQTGDAGELQNVVVSFANELSAFIRAGLPFNSEERLAAVQDIVKEMQDGTV